MSLYRQIRRFPKFVADPSKTEGHFGVGIKGSGKSALGEKIAEVHHWNGYIVFDGLDGNDMEAAFWGIPGPSGLCYNTLLVHPPWYSIKLTDPRFSHIKPISSEIGLLPILKKAEVERRIITIACHLWKRGTVGNLLKDWLFEITEVAPRLDRPIFILMREVGSYAFSQLRIFPELEDEFRRALIWCFREARHHNVSFFFDAHRYIDLHKSIRSLCDHKHVKLSSKEMLPAELHWMFSHVKEWREKLFSRKRWKFREQTYPRVQKLYPNELYSVGHFEELRPIYKFSMASFHHKRPRDDFERITGFRFKFDAAKYDQHMKAEEVERAPKKLRVLQALIKYPEATDIKIAEIVKCSHQYVSMVRREARAS